MFLWLGLSIECPPAAKAYSSFSRKGGTKWADTTNTCLCISTDSIDSSCKIACVC